MNENHWLRQLAAPNLSREFKSMRWKILREGTPIEQFGTANSWQRSWSEVERRGSVEAGAIKLRLRSELHGDDCEMVVLFPQGRRATVCVSSQIGCGVGCVFCATGTMGFRRNLAAEEILEQVALARICATREGRHLRNVVYMGMGEPLHNIENLHESLRWLTADAGFGISARYITVSTSGNPAAMIRLAEEFPRVRLALSLHAGEEKLRRTMMPRVANDLELLRKTIRHINTLQGNAPLWLEVVLLAGMNDSAKDADSLIAFCEGLRVEINLIPYNAISGPAGEALQGTGRISQSPFAVKLREAGIITTVRQSFGQEDAAACGQLVVGAKSSVDFD